MMKSGRILALVLPLVLVGCGGLIPDQPYIAKTEWPLAPNPPPVVGYHAAKGVVLVRSVLAGPGLEQTGLMSLRRDGSLHRGYYNRWAVPPGEALTAALITWLEASGEFKAVVGDGSVLTPNLLVEATLNTLIADPSAREARATMTLVISKPVGLGAVPLIQRRLVAVEPLSGRSAAELVAAQRAAVASLLEQAVQLVRRAQVNIKT